MGSEQSLEHVLTRQLQGTEEAGTRAAMAALERNVPGPGLGNAPAYAFDQLDARSDAAAEHDTIRIDQRHDREDGAHHMVGGGVERFRCHLAALAGGLEDFTDRMLRRATGGDIGAPDAGFSGLP